MLGDTVSGEDQLANGPSISKPTGSEDFETHAGLWVVTVFLAERIGQHRETLTIFLRRFLVLVLGCCWVGVTQVCSPPS